MKTTKNYTVLSLAMIFAAVTSAFSAFSGDRTGQVSANPVVRHQVNVIISGELTLCNTYLVELKNEKGELIAPAKRYISGVSTYTFFENGRSTGLRVASLTVSQFGYHFICETELFTTPAVVAGPFFTGETYTYNLYPQTDQSKH